ncbi:MAG: hypothetical protein ABII26_12015 [Pseudomonadota bacterium]
MELWNAIEPYVINIIPVAIAIALIPVFLRRKRPRENWRSLAEKHGLRIYRENAFLKFTQLFGAQDVKTGNHDFDARFVVKGNDPAGVLAWLDEPRRHAILRILGEDSDIDPDFL